MSNKLSVQHTYSCTYDDTVKLPEGKTGENISDQYIKWGTLFITFDDGSEFECELDMDGEDFVDTKRPSCVAIYNQDENGENDYNKDFGD